jgi:hypothetical protein
VQQGKERRKSTKGKADDDFSKLARNLKIESLLGDVEGIVHSDFEVYGAISH